jgi:uncharacterized protein YfaS (alpha-2-macroglobulin family)
VLVRDPVVVTASLPRFLAPGDESRLLLEIVHATGPSGGWRSVASDTADAGRRAPSGCDAGRQGQGRVAVPVTANLGDRQDRRVLTTPDGKVLTKTLTMPVQVNDPETVQISRLDLKKGQTFTFDAAVFSGLVPGTGKSVMAVGPLARLNAPGLLGTLDRYPYGCTEQ